MSQTEVVLELLSLLKEQVGMDLWMVTRINGDDFIVLHKTDSKYDLNFSQVLSYSATLCHAMVNQQATNISPDIRECDSYQHTAMAQMLSIGAYIGFPLKSQSGELFGSLCAIDPRTKDDCLLAHKDFIATMATTIEHLLVQEKALVDKQRMIDNYYPLMSDSLTGALNRRGWDDVLLKEKVRAQQLGNKIAVGIVNIKRLPQCSNKQNDYAQDSELKHTAMTLMRSIQSGDTIARISENEFGVLLPDCTQQEVANFECLLQARFNQQQISVTMDFTVYRHTEDLQNHVDQCRKRMQETSSSAKRVVII
jgi:diguanylate cyclase